MLPSFWLILTYLSAGSKGLKIFQIAEKQCYVLELLAKRVQHDLYSFIYL